GTSRRLDRIGPLPVDRDVAPPDAPPLRRAHQSVEVAERGDAIDRTIRRAEAMVAEGVGLCARGIAVDLREVVADQMHRALEAREAALDQLEHGRQVAPE